MGDIRLVLMRGVEYDEAADRIYFPENACEMTKKILLLYSQIIDYGKQHAKLKAGLHNIAVKAVDNDGLENIEVIKLITNNI